MRDRATAALAKTCLGWLITLMSLTLATTSVSAAEAFTESTTLQASKALAPSLLKGPHFKVAEKVPNDGLLNHYTVESDYGRFRAVSTLALIKLVKELEAIAEMAKIEQSEVFTQSLKSSAKKTGSGLKNMFKDPAGTFQGAAEGMGKLFDRVDESISGPGPGQAEDSRTQQMIGFSNAKRGVADKLGVDVYSANPVLQKYLDKLAWADYAGGISLGAATSVVSGGVGLVLSTSGGARLLNDVIRTKPPSELRMMNRDKLTSAGMPPDLIELFIGSAVYSPREQTVITASIEALAGVKNREQILKTALQAHNRDMSFVLTSLAVMYAHYHKKVKPLTQIKPLARVLYAQAKDGSAVLALPTDYILWSRRASDATKAIAPAAPGGAKVLWVTGTLSPRATKELERAGWKLHTKVESRFVKTK